jgi:hypothetical protein
METGRREFTNPCRRDGSFQERHPNRARNTSSSRTNRHHPRPRHGYFPPSRASSLAHVATGLWPVHVAANFTPERTAHWAVATGIGVRKSALLRYERRRRHSLNAARIEILRASVVHELDDEPIDTFLVAQSIHAMTGLWHDHVTTVR